MKKKLVYSLVFILAFFLMVNYSYCVLSGNASSDELTDSEKSLIKKFGYGGDYVKRWPDGIVYVYNGTIYKGLPRIIKQINQIIGNKTIFQLSNDKKTSKVVFESYASNKYAAESKWSWKGYNLERWLISLSNKYTHGSNTEKFFLSKFTQIAGFNYQADKKNMGNGGNFQLIKM
jgi:hypothetical protein